MYRVPKIKKFNTITQQSQISWRSNLSSETRRKILIQDISQNLLLLKEDLVNYFESNKDFLFPTSNEEYICLDSSTFNVSPEDLLYKLIDIIKNNDFIFRLEEASTTISSLSKQLEEVKAELAKSIKKGIHDDSLSSIRSDYQGTISQELINKLKEKNKINKKIIKDYDNLVDDYIVGLSQKSEYELKIKNLEKDLRDFQNIKIKNEELSLNNKQMADDIFLNKNEIDELKRINNNLYEENMKTKDELQRLNKIIEFKEKEYIELKEKNNQLSKDNYANNMTLQRNEEKMKLIMDNIYNDKEKNKVIIQDLENKICDKDKEIQQLQIKLENSIKNFIENNKNENLEFMFDDVNDKLKIIYKGNMICTISKFKREFQTSFLSRKKNDINSIIHPKLSEIKKDNNKLNRKMTFSNTHKIKEINNCNLTYKLSHNEYDIDYSNSSNSKLLNDSNKSSSSICLDKLCQQISNSGISNQQSNQKSKSKSNNKNNFKNYVNNFFNCHYEKNQKKLRRAMTDFKIGKRLNNNISKIQSFGIDVESIKEEKEEDNISICSFDCKINSKKRNSNGKEEKSKSFSQISDFLETDSFVPVVKAKDNKFIINCVEYFTIKRKYFYPNNVKLNIKKINIKRIIPMNTDADVIINNNESEGCEVF